MATNLFKSPESYFLPCVQLKCACGFVLQEGLVRGPEKTMFPSCDFALPVSTVSELSAMSHPESLLWDVGLDSDTTFNVFF